MQGSLITFTRIQDPSGILFFRDCRGTENNEVNIRALDGCLNHLENDDEDDEIGEDDDDGMGKDEDDETDGECKMDEVGDIEH